MGALCCALSAAHSHPSSTALPEVDTSGGLDSVTDHRGCRFAVPKRAVVRLTGPFGVPAACIHRLNVNAVAEMVASPPPGYDAGGEGRHDAPISIGGPRTQYLLKGRRWHHVMGLPNPLDGNRPYRIAWGVLLAHARHCGRLAALAMGLPRWLVEGMVFESEAVIEPVIKNRGKLRGRALGERDIAAAEAQVPHVDFGGLQLLFSLSPMQVKSTKWYSGAYKPVTHAEDLCRQADPTWTKKRMSPGSAAIREVVQRLVRVQVYRCKYECLGLHNQLKRSFTWVGERGGRRMSCSHRYDGSWLYLVSVRITTVTGTLCCPI